MSSRHGLFNRKLSVGPTLLMCSALSTPMTSSSDWSASSDSSQPSFPDSRIIFMQSASKQEWSKDDFGNVPVSDSTVLANEVTPPDKRLVQAAARPVCGPLLRTLVSLLKHFNLPAQITAWTSSKLFKVFDNVTPKEYNTLSLLISKDHRYCFYAKLVYHPDLSQLVVMVPYEIHELAMNNFSQCVHNLLQPFWLSNDMDVTVIVNGNLAISDRDFEVVPDFRLSLCSMHNHGEQALIPWWVCKCGFSLTVTTMLRQLGAAAEMAPEMDLTLMISIREKKRKPLPYGHALRTSPKLHCSDFDHTTSVVTLDPVVVGGVSWVEIKLIKLHVFLRGEDGNINFSGEGPLCAQGSVFPNMQMDTVNQLLNLATKWLFLKITSMMEEWYNQPLPVNNSNNPPPGGPGGPGGPGPGGLGPGGPGGPGVPGPSRKWPSTPEPSPSSKRSTSHHSSSRGQQGKSHKRRHSGKKANRK
ncbi:hypothetical protein PAXINDRAFT_7788 [Paxillus involutus ATCC 200175]|nr:hypothetical protein PAXINDRAFT_7788 [Paxillus involutus ATCC 200175]